LLLSISYLVNRTVEDGLERIMREIRRRTRVVGAFPDGQSCLNLAAARLRYIAGTAWSTKCYMNMRPLYQPQLMQTEAVA
jgi:putative transposase